MTDFGVQMFPTDYSIQPAELSKAVEERGFESIFFPEHTHIPASRKTPYPGGGDLPKEYWHTHDPFVALAAAATVTERIKLATGICLIVQRDPIVLANQVASLDVISNGRVIFGIGAGWNAEEMANHGAEYRHRWKIVREKVLAMKEIWTKEEAEFHGEFVDFDPIWSYPKPVQSGGPPIILGSVSKWAADRVVEYCDGWMPIDGRPGLEAGMAALRAAADRASLPFDSLSRTLYGMGRSEERARRAIDLGFTRLVFGLPPAGSEEVLPRLDTYAELANKLR